MTSDEKFFKLMDCVNALAERVERLELFAIDLARTMVVVDARLTSVEHLLKQGTGESFI